jgi:hypothetical protein
VKSPIVVRGLKTRHFIRSEERAFAEEVIQKAISGRNPERAIVSPAIGAAYLDST